MISSKEKSARAVYSAPVCKCLELEALSQFLQVSCTNDQIGDWSSDNGNDINL